MMFEKTYGLLEIPTLAAELLQALQPSPMVWLFSGEMGAGKTSLIKELGKQIGGLGKKFGSFTEGLALPSMETILRERFGMEIISPSVRASKQGQHLEIDVLAYANGDINTAYIVEVKSHAREEVIDQLKTLLEKFRAFFPEHNSKKLYGILAAVDLPFGVRERILKEGLYVARIHDEVFEMDTPSEFQPKHW